MRSRSTACHTFALVSLMASPSEAETPDPTWDVTKPRGASKGIDFTTSEGTWKSTDITSDGRWVAFNVLGHVYGVVATGGQAGCLTQETGVAVNFHPRISPDGKDVAFISGPERAEQRPADAVGKLGDLVVLNADPLENIRNTANTRRVMTAGLLYDADSLDELWPRQRKLGDYYWYVPDVDRSDTRPIDYHDRH